MSRPHRQANVKVLPGHHEPNNFECRVQAVPILDFSFSMSKHAPRLPPAWDRMVTTLAKRTLERLRIELACCVFDTEVMFQQFAPVTFYLDKPLNVSGGGNTSLGTALLTVIDLTRQRRQMLASEGIRCRRAVCPVVTDGYATDPEALEDAVREIRLSNQRREIEFVAIAPDKDCFPQLRSIFGHDPILLDEIDFDTLFHAFTRSLSTYSCSMLASEPEARQLLISELRSRNREAD